MIHARYETDAEARTIRVTMKGHADYAPSGQDIVCAGMSICGAEAAAVAFAAANDCPESVTEHNVRTKTGDYDIFIRAGTDEMFRRLLDMMTPVDIGMVFIASNFSAYVEYTKVTAPEGVKDNGSPT